MNSTPEAPTPYEYAIMEVNATAGALYGRDKFGRVQAPKVVLDAFREGHLAMGAAPEDLHTSFLLQVTGLLVEQIGDAPEVTADRLKDLSITYQHRGLLLPTVSHPDDHVAAEQRQRITDADRERAQRALEKARQKQNA